MIFENVTDCMKKKPKRTLEFFKTIPIFLSFYALHTFLPSFQTSRVLVLLNFNLTMALIVLDLMLMVMACKEFWAIHPSFVLLALPPIAHFVFGVSAGVEVFV